MAEIVCDQDPMRPVSPKSLRKFSTVIRNFICYHGGHLSLSGQDMRRLLACRPGVSRLAGPARNGESLQQLSRNTEGVARRRVTV